MAVPALISEVALCLFGNMCLSFLQALQSALCTYNAKGTKLVQFQATALSYLFTGPTFCHRPHLYFGK